MIRNYVLTALRHSRKSKVNFVFKVGGLSLALVCFMAIAIYVSYQLSFDKFNEDFQQVYRVTSQRKESGVIEKFAIAPAALRQHVNQLPAVVAGARCAFGSHTTLRVNDQVYDCEGMVSADSSIFDVLTFDFILGDRRALTKRNAIVLTRSMAMRMFGRIDVLQQIVSINGPSELLEVTAIIEDTRPDSHFYAEAFVSMFNSYDLSKRNISDPVAFSDESAALYVKIHGDETVFNRQAEAMLDQFLPASFREEYGFGIALQPLADIYLSSDLRYDYATHGSIVYLYTYSVVGVLLLLVAGINYVNLSIADYTGRAAETGVRRVLGARYAQLMLQVSVEAVGFGIVSIALAVLVLYVAFPHIAQLLDPNLRFDMLLRTESMAIVATGMLVLFLLSCWLPARSLSGARITQNLKSASRSYNLPLNRALLFTQFTASVLCLFCTLVVGQQIAFVRNSGLGFDRKNLLVLSMPPEFSVQHLQTFKTEIKRIPGVTSASNSSFRIGNGYWKDWYFVEDGEKVKEIELYEVFSDDELFSALGIPLLHGRTFRSDIPSDSGAAFVINETAARELGWDDPIGKRIYTHPEEPGKWDGTVVGVVADINIRPLYYEVKPLVMRLPWQNEYPDGFVYVRYTGNEQAVVTEIAALYKDLMPGYPLMVRSVDELYNSTHRGEQRAFDSLRLSTIAIVLVAILGIFSMAAFMSARRMKEFGIRKVLGASVRQIAGLNLQYFLRIALWANLIALPGAYWMMSEWLTTFAYRTTITALPFVLVAGISFAIVLVSGGYSAWRSGVLNPVDSIRSE